jgi:dienelactone hydrolase
MKLHQTMKLASKILILLFLLWSNDSVAGNLVSKQLVKSYSVEELRANWKKIRIPEILTPIKNGVDVYEIVYYTKWHDGTQIKASGYYFVPRVQGNACPLVAYHHGTQVERERAFDFSGEFIFCVIFAADGYAVTRPDYIGLGKGDKFHLYQHAESEAQASIDLIRAVRELNPTIKVSLNHQLFLTGYSQGGHATMATHLKIERDLSQEFTVTASAPLSGAYDLIGGQSETMFKPYSRPAYLPYLLFAYAEVYNIYRDKPHTMFKPPFDTLLPNLFDGKHTMAQIDAVLPRIPVACVTDSLVNEFRSNPNFVFTQALKSNSVHNWKAIAPIQMCYCTNDDQVNYLNTIIADKQLRENGSTMIRTVNAGKKFTHQPCAIFAFIYTKIWFDNIRDGKPAKNRGSSNKRIMVDMAKSIYLRSLKKTLKLAPEKKAS